MSLPLVAGNRVLESIARQEGVGALLAFSELHEQIRQRQLAAGAASDSDLSQTERFFLEEVLQLICNRAHTLTQADSVMLALSQPPRGELVCRASAGELPIPRGIRLNSGSEFLLECLASGRTLRCDDARSDERVEFDLTHAMEARSSVIVPLRGRSQYIGVLQAFSRKAWSFTDDDVRSLDLFAELILAALRPEDQDRRFHWLADVAGSVLEGDPALRPLPSEPGARLDDGRQEKGDSAVSPSIASSVSPSFSAPEDESATAEIECEAPLASASPKATVEDRNPRTFAFPAPTFRLQSPEAESDGNVLAAHPGLSVVIGLVAVAALFSAGVWWGMQFRGKAPAIREAAPMAATQSGNTASGLLSVSAPPNGSTAPAAIAPDASDDLMRPGQAQSEVQSGVQGEEQSALSPVPSNKLAALPKITALRHWSSAMGTTVVIDMEDQVPYEVHRLMSPERIYFDLHDTALAADLEGKTFDVGDPALSRMRIAQPVAGVTRVVLDTKGDTNFSVSLESDPYRLIVELREMPKSLLAAKPATSAPAVVADKGTRTPAEIEPTPIKTGKFRIVLDPGHGGWDLGTVGRQGLVEKDLVLDVTQRLGKLLHDRLGSDVMFTRTGDDYLPLEQRADFANHAQADVFISVHANYSSSANARGVETYYTNLFAAPGSKEMDKQALAGAQLTPASLSASALHEKTEESRRLAASVQRSLYATLSAKSSDIRDRGTKDAAFVVLTGTTMPSILTEISFVSSPTDEHNLLSAAYRQQIAEALYQGIARYQQSSPRGRVAQLQPTTVRR